MQNIQHVIKSLNATKSDVRVTSVSVIFALPFRISIAMVFNIIFLTKLIDSMLSCCCNTPLKCDKRYIFRIL